MKWYQLIFKQEQPIYLGKTKYGVLSQTRLYINGYTMCGALTNIYAIKHNLKDIEKTKAIGKRLKTITCFFPAFKEKNDYTVLYPRYDQGSFLFQSEDKKERIFEEEFRYRFVDSSTSTSIEAPVRTAKRESLHITEFICPKDKITGKPLYWVGLLGLESDEGDIQIEDDFSEVFIGGDTRYGFGYLKLVKALSGEAVQHALNVWGLNDDGTMKRMKSNEPMTLMNYLHIKPEFNIRIKGQYGLLYEYSVADHKQALFCVYPGSQLFNDLNAYADQLSLVKGKFMHLPQHVGEE